MRSLFLLVFGAFCGVIGTVLLFSLDTTFEDDPDDSAGGGNARIVFDEAGLEAIIKKEIANLEGFGAVTGVDVDIEEEGVIRIKLTAGGRQLGLSGEIVTDPNVVDGRLEIAVVEAGLGGLGAPALVAALIERELQASLDALDPDLEYKLVSITTTNHELSLEVEL